MLHGGRPTVVVVGVGAQALAHAPGRLGRAAPEALPTAAPSARATDAKP